MAPPVRRPVRGRVAGTRGDVQVARCRGPGALLRVPAPGRPVETIKPPPKFDSTKAREALDKEIEKFDIRADERHDQEEEARKKAAEDKENQVACQEARSQARSLADKPRSYRIEPDDIRVTQTDEEHQASIAKTRDWIALHCQP